MSATNLTPAGEANTPRPLRGLPLWPIAVVVAGFPLWWLMGLSALAWPLVSTFVMLPMLLLHADVRLPAGFGWWMAFIGWVVLSTTQIEGLGSVPSFGYRLSVYLAATIGFVYVYNTQRTSARTHRVLTFLTVLWSALAIGGIIGIAFPGLEVPSPAHALLPQGVTNNGLIEALTQPRFSQTSRLFGHVLGRPSALAPYTNGWGSTFGILIPAVLAWLTHAETATVRRAFVILLLGASVAPVVVSLNRGLWLSLLLVVVYVVFRLLRRGQWLPLAIVVAALAGAAAVIMMSPLSSLVLDRSHGGHSDEGRASLYVQSIEAGLEEPVLGHGTPQERADKDEGPSVGTHGHVWLVLVSQGIVGLVLYLGWWASAALRAWAQRGLANVFLYAAVPVVIMQSLVYEHTPMQLPLAMVITALLLSDARPPRGPAHRSSAADSRTLGEGGRAC